MENEQIVMLLQKVSDKANSNEKRIEKLERDQESLQKIATSVEVLAEQMKGLNTNVATLSVKVDKIEEKPVKRYDTLITAIITAVVSTVIGIVIGGLF